MNAVVDETSDQLAQNNIEGPGARLRAARLESDLELDRVAAQLHLRPFQVEALEQDNYDGFPARVFVRGYLRNYARLVGLPAETVMALFEAVHPDPDRPSQLRRVGTHRPQVGSGHGMVRVVSWALLLGILALFFVWWAGYLKLDSHLIGSDAELSTVTPNGQATQISPELLLEGPGGSVPLPAAPAVPEAESSVPDEIPAGEADPAVPDQAAPATKVPPPAEDVAIAAVTPSATPSSEPVVPAKAEVVLSLSGPCWVKIRDSSNTYKLIGEFKAGTRHVLEGTPPYRILLGNAAVAELTVNGQPVDLVPHTSGQVARLTLDPSAQ